MYSKMFTEIPILVVERFVKFTCHGLQDLVSYSNLVRRLDKPKLTPFFLYKAEYPPR